MVAVLAASSCLVQAYKMYQSRIPNGNRVPNPCQEGEIWNGVGHQSSMGGNARNPFGLDFKAAGFQWTTELCRKDSDGDGLTNGQELGDPNCVWTSGTTPERTTGLSHPGICPLESSTCKNSWTVCPKAFNCPAMKDPNVMVRNFTLNKNTPVPAKETTYICQAFELNNTASPMHMIGSLPIIVNTNVMHHMILYACTTRPEQAMFDSPRECFMGRSGCDEMLNLWAFGLEGECFNSNAGFLVGGQGYRYALLELHWNNPASVSTYTDSSGFSLYFTPTLRTYNLGTLMYGEGNLVIPPRQAEVSFNHTCPSVCTNYYHAETRYITAAAIHMHTYGIKGRVSLWRNGALIKDLSPLQVYDYNTPQVIAFDPPIEYRKGDEVKTECYFSSLRSNHSIFFGESTSDEMCLSFMTFYPNNVTQNVTEKLSRCIGVSGINECWLRSGITPHVERGCNITAMRSGTMPTQVAAAMNTNRCFSRTGCDPLCRDYLNYTLWPSNACYDPKRSRQMAEILGSGYIPSATGAAQMITQTLYGQRFCEQEIYMLAEMDRQAAARAMMPSSTPMMPEMPPPGGLTSEHLLIIIIVCSCLGFILILGGLGLLASRLQAGSRRSAHAVKLTAEPDVGVQSAYDNQASVEKTDF